VRNAQAYYDNALFTTVIFIVYVMGKIEMPIFYVFMIKPVKLIKMTFTGYAVKFELETSKSVNKHFYIFTALYSCNICKTDNITKTQQLTNISVHGNTYLIGKLVRFSSCQNVAIIN
jgi:hypothetical protein